MTGRQRSKLDMFEAAESVCSQYKHVWGQLPAFRSAFEQFQAELTVLTKLATTQRRHTGGVAQEKVRTRQELCALAFEVASAVRASALAAGDSKAAAKVAFSVTQLRIGKDTLCLERCRQILTTAEGQQTHLESFGITRQRLTELSAALERFSASTRETRQLRSENKTVTAQVPAAFKAVEEIVYNQLDNLIPQFRSSSQRFYNLYQEARVMRSALQPQASVFEAEPEEPPMLD